uniref:1-phosphatidylinositol-3-phosphate 5-kinase n=2 Tax=Kalanchoe fedtschenkoi TaxID=63787 RepID=A0A7N0TLC9_KALFE
MISCVAGEFNRPVTLIRSCDCGSASSEVSTKCSCESCGRMMCEKCMHEYECVVSVPSNGLDAASETEEIRRCCRVCVETNLLSSSKSGGKVHPSALAQQTSESPSISRCDGKKKANGTVGHDYLESRGVCPVLAPKYHSYSPEKMNCSTFTSYSAPLLPVLTQRSSSRSDEDEAEHCENNLFSPSSCQDLSDLDNNGFCGMHELYINSVGSSLIDSPSSNYFTSNRLELSPESQGQADEHKRAAVTRFKLETRDAEETNESSSDLSIGRKEQKPLDFDNNGLIWYPPPPEDENFDAENSFFSYDDEDDDIGEAGAMFSSSSNLESILQAKERHGDVSKESGVGVQDHFRALVANLLQGEGFIVGKENSDGDWLDIVSNLAWQAANFVKPDTSRGGSMDPIDYVKIKCIATGNPVDSTLIKGVVCTKNVKHKRMTSQYKKARLLLLGGALEYQRLQNQLASIDTLLQQDIDHLKLIVSKIEVHRPNVLLVEKSVSSYAQEYLLEKEISLVLNVKRQLLERIAQCSGAHIMPSLESISTARLGHCELFHIERVCEEHGSDNQLNKKMTKTLMFFEGCPRRLGCTVLLKGASREELKKVKHVVQYALFAAYHLSLETSFLADEGASIPKMAQYLALAVPERLSLDNSISNVSNSAPDQEVEPSSSQSEETKSSSGSELQTQQNFPSTPCLLDSGSPHQNDSFDKDLTVSIGQKLYDSETADALFCISHENSPTDRQTIKMHEPSSPENSQENDNLLQFFSGTESQQSILVSFSSCCVPKETLCERSRLLRIKFYGCFDKPLGRYLRDDLFGQTSYCRSCEEPAEAHVQCFTHQLGSLTISVKRLPNVKLPGEQDGKIWMWHRCLKCTHVEGIPPATRRVIMSDAAWGLSFGKFLELSFSNHATANRVATCGHSLQRDCLRYYGFDNMVAFFRYSPIDILSVHLPPSLIEFDDHVQDSWIKKEAAELLSKTETLYAEISNVLQSIEQKSTFGRDPSDANELLGHVMELKDLVDNEKNHYKEVLEPACLEVLKPDQPAIDILELNGLRRSLLIGSHLWDRRLYTLDSLIKPNSKASARELFSAELNDCRNDEFYRRSRRLESRFKETTPVSSNLEEAISVESCLEQKKGSEESTADTSAAELPISASDCNEKEGGNADGQDMESNLSDKIDVAWSGTESAENPADEASSDLAVQPKVDSPPLRRLAAPMRVYSFDSATRVREKIQRALSPSPLHLSTLTSFHGSTDYRSLVKDPTSNIRRTLSQVFPQEARYMNNILKSTPSLISSANHIAEGARLLLPQTGQSNITIAVYDNELTSIISYALSCKEYENWIYGKPVESEAAATVSESHKEGSLASELSSWPSFGSLDMEYIHYKSYGYEDLSSSSMGSRFTDSKKSPHLTLSFKDESLTVGSRAKFSVTCYFAMQFESLRRKCCPCEVNFIRSLSRCSTWSAQGGKSNVYFAKTSDERFIIKQVTKTELDSFEEFAPEYFKYLTTTISSGSPTCLAKIVGLYQVTARNTNGGKVTKMDVMVMENLFYKRKLSRVYDLKGSARSRYNADATGVNKVLLDTNLLETLRTDPLFLGSKAKRSLERAVWNDTSFLASVDVMDYSLLVGVDNESKELVLGIIDYMRQYTWDKHLETWVKASGILGGPKNAAPTVISPKQYKRRFRKAMTTYFLTVPDQWPS